MSDLVGNLDDRFSLIAAQVMMALLSALLFEPFNCKEIHVEAKKIICLLC